MKAVSSKLVTEDTVLISDSSIDISVLVAKVVYSVVVDVTGVGIVVEVNI